MDKGKESTAIFQTAEPFVEEANSEEIQEAIRMLRSNKIPGVANATSELLKREKAKSNRFTN